MRNPYTADERERRIVEYLVTLHRGRLAEFKLMRMNRIANFRKQLMALIEEMVETRAEDLAAGMLMRFAERPPENENRGPERIARRRRRMPVWLKSEERGRRKQISGKSE